MKNFIFYILFFQTFFVAAQCPGPPQRNALINLQRSIDYLTEGKAGQIPLTDTCGNQRYAQYVEVNPDTIAYTPTSTGNTDNLSEFVYDPTGALFYIDWQGNSVEFASGGSGCDVDWLEIGNGLCPDNINDSIYKQKYASVGARYVWPGAEFLVNDSTSSGIAVVQGSRNARLALYDSQGGTFMMIDHGGSTPTVYFPVDANMVFKTTAGTPQTPVGSQVNHFAINTQDSTIQAHQYPNTMIDTNSVLNLLYTDGVGKFRSAPLQQVIDSSLAQVSQPDMQIVSGTGTGITSNADFLHNISGNMVNCADTFWTTRLIRSNIPSGYENALTNRPDAGICAQHSQSAPIAITTMNIAYGALAVGRTTNSVLQNITISPNLRFYQVKYNPGGSSIIPVAAGDYLGGIITQTHTGQVNTLSDTYTQSNGAYTMGITADSVAADGTVATSIRFFTKNTGGGASPTGTQAIHINKYQFTGIGTDANSTNRLFVSGTPRFDLGSDATGDVFYRDVSGNFTRLGIGSPGQVLTVAGGLPSWAAASGGSGTVTSFSSGNLSPLFTTSVATATTTPALSFALDNQSANIVFGGPASGGAATPTFRSLVAADLPTGAGGAWLDGGNSFGATGTLGTNDNNTVAIETNNVPRATISSGASTGGAWTMTDVTANTNTVEDVLTVQANSTGTTNTNYGVGLLFQGESSTTNNRDMARISPYWISATDVARAAYMGIELATAGGGMQRYATFESSNSGSLSLGTALAATFHRGGITTATNFTVGASGSTLILGGSTGGVTISSSGTNNISIYHSANLASSTSGLQVGNATSFTQTSGTRNYIDYNSGFAPTSGTAVHNQFAFSGTFNQTGGANGITRGIFLNQTLTAVADMRLIEIAANGSNTKGIYQTGSSVTNNFVGATAFGSTTAPGTAVDVVGTTSTEHLIGQNLTPTIAVNTGGAGTGATASMTNAQSSDLAGRFSISSGTGATTGLWATVTFDDAFGVTPVVQVYAEDADASNLKHYVNVNTTSFEFFVNGGQTDTTSYDFNFIIIGGK